MCVIYIYTYIFWHFHHVHPYGKISDMWSQLTDHYSSKRGWKHVEPSSNPGMFLFCWPVPSSHRPCHPLQLLQRCRWGRFTADREERLAFAETNPDEEYDDVVPQEAYVPRRRWAKWRESIGKRRCISSRCIFGVGASKTGCTWMYISSNSVVDKTGKKMKKHEWQQCRRWLEFV